MLVFCSDLGSSLTAFELSAVKVTAAPQSPTSGVPGVRSWRPGTEAPCPPHCYATVGLYCSGVGGVRETAGSVAGVGAVSAAGRLRAGRLRLS